MKLEVNHRKRNEKKYYMQNKHYATKNQWVNNEIKEEIKYFEANDNENTTIQNQWDAAKAVLRGKFLEIQASLRNKNLT